MSQGRGDTELGGNCLPETQSQYFGRVEGDMPRSYDSLTLADAKRMLSAAEAKAATEEEARQAAETEIAHLRAEIERLRGGG